MAPCDLFRQRHADPLAGQSAGMRTGRAGSEAMVKALFCMARMRKGAPPPRPRQ
ncbi:Variant surface glycoprotein (VSG)-related [Cereibacter sphaeroides KD131]|nr:Variant surface glycoprotein (VSG)-related [Cereibacter sphaeroides KD131]